jgi:hypothetical protein
MRYLCAVLLLLCAGCSSFGITRTPVELVPARTNVIQVVTTNVIQREVWSTNTVQVAPQRTNDAGITLPPLFSLQPVRDLVATQILQTNLQPVITPPVWFTNLALSDGVTTAIQTAGDLAPVPWGGILGQGVTAIAGVAFGVMNWFGRRKALKQAGEAQTTADTFKDATKATVLGFEELRKIALRVPGYTEEMDKNIMRVVTGIQVAAGVQPVVAAIVDEHTGYTTQQ